MEKLSSIDDQFLSMVYQIIEENIDNENFSVSDLAEKAGLYRQVTYDTLKRLLEKGFVTTVKRGRTQLYKAAAPEIILESLNNKVDQFSQVIPQLNTLTSESKQPVSVEVFSGSDIVGISFKGLASYFREGGTGEVVATVSDEEVARQTRR